MNKNGTLKINRFLSLVEKNVIDVESDHIWNVGNNTSIDYRIVPTQISWRSPAFYVKYFSNDSKFVLRHQISLVGDWIANGPEDYYLGVSAVPSMEWWSLENKRSVYLAVGGDEGFSRGGRGRIKRASIG